MKARVPGVMPSALHGLSLNPLNQMLDSVGSGGKAINVLLLIAYGLKLQKVEFRDNGEMYI